MTLGLFLILAAALAFGMMVLSVFTTVLAYLIAFGMIGLIGWVLLKARNAPNP